MRKLFVVVSVFVAIISFAASSGRLFAQGCAPGFTGPYQIYPVNISYVDENGKIRQCTYTIHFCIKYWNDGGIARYSYNYWLEAWNCPLSAMTQEQAAYVYSQAGSVLIQTNPEEFAYPDCGYQDGHVLVDMSHADCAWEEVVEHNTPENPDAPPSYKYNQCPGSGTCYERYWVCSECVYGHNEAPNSGCKDGPPPTRKLSITKTNSWTTGDANCTNIFANGAERPCIPICGADAPGPKLGLVDSGESPTLVVQTVQSTQQESAAIEHQHDTNQR